MKGKPTGIIFTKEVREKIGSKVRIALTGRHLSQEMKQKLSVAVKNSPKAKQQRERLHKASRGRKLGPKSEETKRKISESLKGRNSYVRTEEHRKKMSDLAKKRLN
jgi:hypothetical protein